MREIKFRAWTDKGGMITPCLWLDKYNHFVGEDYTNNQYGNVLDVMEFTGLHDKNGREIWEGDILKRLGWDCLCVVHYNPPTATFVALPFYRDLNWLDQDINSFNDPAEYVAWDGKNTVVGNIYENADLIKSAQYTQQKSD